MHNKTTHRGTRTSAHNAGEVGARTQAMDRGNSGREASASLATASAEDRAAGTGTHAESEAVRASPTTVIGLERALHLELLQV